MKPAISFYTLGCRLNQSETAVIERGFELDGYSIVDFQKPADVAVINTCTVTENGDADTRRLINKAVSLNPKVRIALIGCQAQTQKEKLTELPNVRWVIGNGRKMDLRTIISEAASEKAVVITPAISREPFTVPFTGIDKKLTRANIKIQDGCDFFCSFCDIPFARGRARSRVFDDIIKETNALVVAGYKEVVLTGINIGTYENNSKTISDVISKLETIAGLERIRISSIEPTTIPDEIIGKMSKGNQKLCRHLHIPLQSGNDGVLSEMKRKYTTQEFKNFITYAFDRVPGICIGTDVIVGFPGETDQQFEETLANLKDWPIHYFHVFSYSKRVHAQSRKRTDSIPLKTIQKRSQTLRTLSQRKRELFHSTLIGSTQTVLLEQKKADNTWEGITDNYVRVFIKSDEGLENQMLTVRLSGPHPKGMTGEIL